MRARMALRYANIDIEIREITLREKPAHMLSVSPKGTVPVLVLASGQVLEQSLDIMDWALEKSDVHEWITQDQAVQKLTANLIATNDGAFKEALDKYKYPIRFPENTLDVYRAAGEEFLQRLELLLRQNTYLCCNTISKADVAIFPFVRQFSMVDEAWYEVANYPALKAWLNGLLHSQLFIDVMQKYPVWKNA
jgi:glutathione S-transferase